MSDEKKQKFVPWVFFILGVLWCVVVLLLGGLRL